MKLKNKVVIITGAKQGIGFGIAMAFAKENYQVVVSDLEQKDCDNALAKIKKAGGQGLAIKCDISNKREVDNLINQTFKHYKRLDVLVNNAGIFPFVPFLKMTENNWDKVIDINLKGIFLCSQSAIKKMKKGGKIVNISSIASIIGFEGLTHYCASKGGVNAFIRALALEVADKKINVNAIAPGAISTPGAIGTMTEEVKKQTIAMIPAKRFGKPEDIASLAVFLASEKADYITGQTIVVDGGWTLR